MPKKTYKASQEPRIDIYHKGSTQRADLLLELVDEYGQKLLPWQKYVLKRWLAEDRDGNFVNLNCGLSVPRQNGKTEIIVNRIIYGIIFRKAVGLFTAQKQTTVDVVKRRVEDFFYDSPYEEIFNLLSPRFRQKRMNYNFIEFTNGAVYRFATRTRLGGLGDTNDEVLCDEAAEMVDSHQSTLLPTISAAKTGNPQMIYCGTPPMAETVGEVFGRIRKQALAGAKGTCWTEWSVENLTDRDDMEAWYDTNPSLGTFLLPSAIQSESHQLSTDDFNRMRLGWWSGIEEKRAIPQATWDKLYNANPEFDDKYMPIYSVKFSPDRSTYALAVAQPLKSGRIHVEIVMSDPMERGFSKLSKWLIDRWRKCAWIIVDGVTGQAILHEDLTSGGVPKKKIIMPNMKDVVAAHQFMQDAIDRGELSHFGQPLLDQSVRITKKRMLGRYGGFGWESMTNNLSTAPLDASTFALWGQKTHSKEQVSEMDASANSKKWHDILSNL